MATTEYNDSSKHAVAEKINGINDQQSTALLNNGAAVVSSRENSQDGVAVADYMAAARAWQVVCAGDQLAIDSIDEELLSPLLNLRLARVCQRKLTLQRRSNTQHAVAAKLVEHHTFLDKDLGFLALVYDAVIADLEQLKNLDAWFEFMHPQIIQSDDEAAAIITQSAVAKEFREALADVEPRVPAAARTWELFVEDVRAEVVLRTYLRRLQGWKGVNPHIAHADKLAVKYIQDTRLRGGFETSAGINTALQDGLELLKFEYENDVAELSTNGGDQAQLSERAQLFADNQRLLQMHCKVLQDQLSIQQAWQCVQTTYLDAQAEKFAQQGVDFVPAAENGVLQSLRSLRWSQGCSSVLEGLDAETMAAVETWQALQQNVFSMHDDLGLSGSAFTSMPALERYKESVELASGSDDFDPMMNICLHKQGLFGNRGELFATMVADAYALRMARQQVAVSDTAEKGLQPQWANQPFYLPAKVSLQGVVYQRTEYANLDGNFEPDTFRHMQAKDKTVRSCLDFPGQDGLISPVYHPNSAKAVNQSGGSSRTEVAARSCFVGKRHSSGRICGYNVAGSGQIAVAVREFVQKSPRDGRPIVIDLGDDMHALTNVVGELAQLGMRAENILVMYQKRATPLNNLPNFEKYLSASHLKLLNDNAAVLATACQ